MGALDEFSRAKAGAAGVVLSALNPKNLLLAVAGAAAIAQTGISTGQKVGSYVVLRGNRLDRRRGPRRASTSQWANDPSTSWARSRPGSPANNAVIMAFLMLIIWVAE